MKKYLFILSNQLRWFIICATVVLIYLSIIIIYAENIPFGDDVAVLTSLYDIHHEPAWSLKLKTLFAFHNEHRIVVPRLITILLYYIQFKQISITWWILIGNISIFFILYLYYKTGFSNRKLFWFIPVLFFILQPIHYELMYWGMAALQNIGVLVLSSLAFYYLFYSQNKPLSLSMAILAVFTSANGLFTFIIGTALLFYKKEWSTAVLWLVIGITSGFLYWTGFSDVINSDSPFEEPFHIINFLTTFVSLAGGIVYTQSFPILSLVLGSFILFIIAFFTYQSLIVQPATNKKTYLFFLSCLGFILLTAAAVSFGRAPSNILSGSRYKLYSTLLISLTYIISINWIEKRNYISGPILMFAMLFWLASYTHFTSRFDIHSRLLFSQFFNWKFSGVLDINSPFAEKYYSDHWYEFYKSGQYTPPQSVLNKSQKIFAKLNKFIPLKASFLNTQQGIFITPVRLPVNEYYAVNKSQNKLMIYPLNADNFYHTLFFSSTVNYSASINPAYWLEASEKSLPVVSSN